MSTEYTYAYRSVRPLLPALLEQIPAKHRPSAARCQIVCWHLCDQYRTARGYVDDTRAQIAAANGLSMDAVERCLSALSTLGLWVRDGADTRNGAGAKRVPGPLWTTLIVPGSTPEQSSGAAAALFGGQPPNTTGFVRGSTPDLLSRDDESINRHCVSSRDRRTEDDDDHYRQVLEAVVRTRTDAHNPRNWNAYARTVRDSFTADDLERLRRCAEYEPSAATAAAYFESGTDPARLPPRPPSIDVLDLRPDPGAVGMPDTLRAYARRSPRRDDGVPDTAPAAASGAAASPPRVAPVVRRAQVVRVPPVPAVLERDDVVDGRRKRGTRTRVAVDQESAQLTDPPVPLEDDQPDTGPPTAVRGVRHTGNDRTPVAYRVRYG